MTNLTEESPSTSGLTRYELSKGDDFYGVVDTAADGRPVIARFPLSAAGWFSARGLCEQMKLNSAGSTSAAIGDELPSAPLAVPALLIAAGVLLGFVGLFPNYSSLSSLASHSDQLVAHLFSLVGWAVVAALIAWRRPMARAASAFGIGLSAMSIGFLLTDVTTIASSRGETAGAGIYLALIGWALCAIGSVAAALASWRSLDTGLVSPTRRRYAVLAGLVVIFSIITFALPWDRYRLNVGATGQVQTVTAGNAFANPGSVIVCELIVMAAMAVLLFGSTLLRSIRVGAALFAGALLPLVAQIVSAVLQPAPPLTAFGVTPQIAAQEQMRLDAGYTSWFYLFCMSIALLIVVDAWMTSHARASE